MHFLRRFWWSIALGAFLLWAGIGFFGAQTACAHDPRFACSPRDDAHPVRVPDASKSWAFYGHLGSGQTDTYALQVDRPMRVPVGILVTQRDARSNPGRPYLTVVDGQGATVAAVDLSRGENFYEPFSRIDYLKSPDKVIELQPGSYRAVVGMHGAATAQRYVLALGEAERFTLGEMPYVMGAISRIRAQRF